MGDYPMPQVRPSPGEGAERMDPIQEFAERQSSGDLSDESTEAPVRNDVPFRNLKGGR